MKVFLGNAFAAGCLGRIIEFHLSSPSTDPSTHSFSSFKEMQNRVKQARPGLCFQHFLAYSIIPSWIVHRAITRCLEHSILFSVNNLFSNSQSKDYHSQTNQLPTQFPAPSPTPPPAHFTPTKEKIKQKETTILRHNQAAKNSNLNLLAATSVLTATTLPFIKRAGITAAAGTRLALF